MPPLAWRTALKGLAGFAAGLALWILLTPLYDRFLAAAAEKSIRAFERPPVTRLRQAADQNATVDRADFDPRSPRPGIPIRDLTFNFLLLTALFAANRRTFSDRNIGGFLLATLILAATHVLGVVIEVQSIYSNQLGMWSQVHYGKFARTFWGVAGHFYRLVLMYAIAFGLWWLFREAGEPAAPAAARKRKRR